MKKKTGRAIHNDDVLSRDKIILRLSTMKKKILIVFGTRPEAIKLAPVIHEIRRSTSGLVARVCVTAQHREMLDQVLRLFALRVHHDLNIMQKGQSLEEVTSRVILGMRKVIQEEKPDMMVVQGDTTTTFAAALAAFYQDVPIAHVEAGLRTWKKRSPFPEEINRTLTTHLADLHFAPTEQSRSNLLKEGVPSSRVLTTGNTVIDALLRIIPKVRSGRKQFEREFYRIDFTRRMILVTGHRRENFGPGFLHICEAIREIAMTEKGLEIVYPVHLNPNVQAPVRAILSGLPNVHLLNPLEYSPFLFFMDRSYLILTDSGGVQEEAPSLGKPVLVMRNDTERPEAVRAGTVKLVGTDQAKIVLNARKLLHDRNLYRRMSRAHNPYGDGKSSPRIVKAIRAYLRDQSA